MSSGSALGNGPPDRAPANGAREERTAPPSPVEADHADPGGADAAGDGTGHTPGNPSPGNTDTTTGAAPDASGKRADAPATAPPVVAEKPTSAAAHTTTSTTTPTGDATNTGERKPAETFWLPPIAHSTGDATASAAAPALDTHHVLLGSPGEAGGRLGGVATVQELGAIWAAGAAQTDTAGDGRGAAPAADGAVPSLSEMAEGVADFLPGIVVDAGTELAAVGAGVLDRLSPPLVIDGVTRAAEQIAVRLAGEPEGESGSAWESWAVAAGLAAASVELARRQLRRRAARTARPAWYRGVCDVF